MSLVIFGDIFCDILVSNLSDLPSWGEDKLGSISILPGGSALNTTVHAANYSLYCDNNQKNQDDNNNNNNNEDNNNNNFKVRILSAIGNDVQGHTCHNVLLKDNILPDLVIKNNSRTGSCIVLSGQDRAFISDRGCIDEMILDWFENINFNDNKTFHLHCAGYYNCGAMRNYWSTLLQMAKQAGLTTSLNPQFDATLKWDGIQEICKDIDILFCNQDEAKSLSGEVEIEKCAEKLLEFGCQYVIITLSKNGCSVYSYQNDEINNNNNDNNNSINNITNNTNKRINCIHQNAFHVEDTKFIDATGAGDSFAAGFLVEWIKSNHNMLKSLRAGCLTGACAVQLIGGSNVPKMELLSEYDHIQT